MYKLTSSSTIIRTTDGASIPADLRNSDYAAYLVWRVAGNTPEPVDVLPRPSYKELRAAAYPPITNYLDGVVKGDASQVQAYKDACLAVKAKYPKPVKAGQC